MGCINGNNVDDTKAKIDNILGKIHHFKELYGKPTDKDVAKSPESEKKGKAMMITFATLVMIEKNSIQPYEVNLSPNGEQCSVESGDGSKQEDEEKSIAGEFSSLLALPADTLKINWKTGRINTFQFLFIKHMNELIGMYNGDCEKEKIEDAEELVAIKQMHELTGINIGDCEKEKIEDTDELVARILGAIDAGLGGANNNLVLDTLRYWNCRRVRV